MNVSNIRPLMGSPVVALTVTSQALDHGDRPVIAKAYWLFNNVSHVSQDMPQALYAEVSQGKQSTQVKFHSINPWLPVSYMYLPDHVKQEQQMSPKTSPTRQSKLKTKI